MTANGTFDIDSWDQDTYDEQEGLPLVKARVTKTFKGDVAGTSTAELLMAGTSAYVGMERIVGTVNGKAGTFVLHHSASAAEGARSASWTIVQGSGTGELSGIKGEAQIGGEPGATHTFTLEYELG